MSELERKLHEAFDAVRLPEDLAARTLAGIEAARASEAAANSVVPDEASATADDSVERAAFESGTRSVAPAVEAAAKRHARRPRRWARIAVAACLAAALVGGGGMVYASESAYVEISTDGAAQAPAASDGPSQDGAAESAIELGLNCFNVVVRATGLNDAGEALLQRIDVVGKSYEEAAELLLGQDATGDGGFVDVTVTSGNAGQRDYLGQTSESCLGHRDSGTYACEHASEEEWQAGRDSGMGTARYQAFVELQQLDPSVTAEDCAGLTLREMRLMIDALESGEASSADEARSQAESAAGQGAHHGAGDGGASNGGAGQTAGQGQASGQSADGQGSGAGQGSGQGAGSGQGGHGHGVGQGQGQAAGQGQGTGGHHGRSGE